MKKFVALILAVIMSMSLVACGGSKGPTLETNSKNDKEKFDEIVLINNEYCACTIIGVNPNGNVGYQIKVRCENKTEDVTLCFTTENGSMNDTMINAYLLTQVEPGKKGIDYIVFHNYMMEDRGLNPDNILTLDFSLKVFEWNDWMDEPYAEGDFTLNF